MKKNESWVAPPKLPCTDSSGKTAPDELDLPLLPAFIKAGEKNYLGNFKFSGPGNTFVDLEMKLERMEFPEGETLSRKTNILCMDFGCRLANIAFY